MMNTKKMTRRDEECEKCKQMNYCCECKWDENAKTICKSCLTKYCNSDECKILCNDAIGNLNFNIRTLRETVNQLSDQIAKMEHYTYSVPPEALFQEAIKKRISA